MSTGLSTLSIEVFRRCLQFLHYYYYYYSYYHHHHHHYVSFHRPLVPGMFLNQRWSPHSCVWLHNLSSWSPLLMLQVSDCSTFRIMCDVPSTALFCSEAMECFPGMASKSFFKPFITIPVARIITGRIIHFMSHIRFSLYINSCI